MTLCTYESATFEWQPNERKPIVHNFWLMTHRNIPIVCLLPCSFDSLLSYICSNGGGRLRGGVDQFLDMFTKKTTLLTLRRRRCVAIFEIWILHYALSATLRLDVLCSLLLVRGGKLQLIIANKFRVKTTTENETCANNISVFCTLCLYKRNWINMMFALWEGILWFILAALR